MARPPSSTARSLRLSGEDVRGFLQGLVTNDLDTGWPGPAGLGRAAQRAGQGPVRLHAVGRRREVLVDCEPRPPTTLAGRLTLYRLRRAIVIGRSREEELSRALGAGWREGPADPRLPGARPRWLAPAGDGEADASAELARAPPAARCDRRRGRARRQDTTLWLECNANELDGVSFTKGCYVGQENTARMNYRNKVNRRLVVVPTDASGARTRIHYPSWAWPSEHRRVDDLGGAIVPDWLAEALREGPVPIPELTSARKPWLSARNDNRPGGE